MNQLAAMQKKGQTTLTREILDSDIERIADLFSGVFGPPPAYYRHFFNILRQHKTPPDYPKYGWLLEMEDKIVGAIILVHSDVGSEETRVIRCHCAAWCFEPGFRSYATIFTKKVLNQKDVTYVNLSAHTNVHPLLMAQGFQKFTNGQFFSVPLSIDYLQKSIKIVRTNRLPEEYKVDRDYDLMLDHERYGCICIWCVTPESAHPFVFQPRTIKRFIPGVRLIYCRDISELSRFSGPLSAYLALRGRLIITINTNGPVPGLRGRYFDDLRPQWYRGVKPRLGDLAYTLRAMYPYYNAQSSYVQVLQLELKALSRKIREGAGQLTLSKST